MHFTNFFFSIEHKKMGRSLCHHVLLKAVAADLSNLLMTVVILKAVENKFSSYLRRSPEEVFRKI